MIDIKINTREIAVVKIFHKRVFTYLPIISLLLIKRSMNINTTGNSIPFNIWDQIIIDKSGKPGINIIAAPATIRNV